MPKKFKPTKSLLDVLQDMADRFVQTPEGQALKRMETDSVEAPQKNAPTDSR